MLRTRLHARQRLEFLRFHLDRHRAQVERLAGHPGYPAAWRRAGRAAAAPVPSA